MAAKYKDSASINFNGGNLWKEVGTWTAAASQTSGQLPPLNDLHVWLGLKNSDDQGTRFDLRAEVYRNGVLISSGQTLCIPDITRNDTQAKEAVVSFGGFNSINMNGTTESLSVKILTRVGTNTSCALCTGHNSAAGLRLYFDITIRPAKLGTLTSVASHFSPLALSGVEGLAIEPNDDFFAVSLKLPAPLQFKADAPASLFQQQSSTTTIDYAYDPLYRLTSADYSTGDFYHYTYDSVGNRLSEETQLATKNYVYDEANRLASVDGVNYTFDSNGNLLNDGQNTYVYDSANSLTSVDGTSSYRYNGLGDRLQQTVNNQTTTYALDLNAGVTEVLSDNENSYLYGLGRISQTGNLTEYFLGDALGSVRQLVNGNGDITLAKAYDPYGVVTHASGAEGSAYGYTGESQDAVSGMVYLRARYYNVTDGRFLSRDTWGGDDNSPMSYDRWLYVYNNPLRYIDPSGRITEQQSGEADKIVDSLYSHYNVQIRKDWGYREILLYTIPEPISVGCQWEEGNWRSLRELRLVKQAVVKIAQKLGGDDKFKAAMKQVRITRYAGTSADAAMSVPLIASDIASDLRIPDAFFDGKYVTDDYDRYTLIHELGHRWDFQTNFSLSMGLMKALKTWICDDNGNNCRWYPFATYLDPTTLKPVWEKPAGVRLHCSGQPPYDESCPAPYALTYGLSGKQPWQPLSAYYGILPGIEDWAESFANYVDPSYYPSLGLTGLVSGGIRENYVRSQINSLP